MIIHNVEQGSDEWKQVKLGKIGSSVLHEIMGARGLGKTGYGRAYKILAERLTGVGMADTRWSLCHRKNVLRFYIV